MAPLDAPGGGDGGVGVSSGGGGIGGGSGGGGGGGGGGFRSRCSEQVQPMLRNLNLKWFRNEILCRRNELSRSLKRV